MVPQTCITEVKLGGLYVVAHHHGPSYTGPSGGYHFEGGLVATGELVSGAAIRNGGLANITHYWEAKPDHALAWDGETWVYDAVAPAPVPVKPVVKVDPPKGKRKRGRR